MEQIDFKNRFRKIINSDSELELATLRDPFLLAQNSDGRVWAMEMITATCTSFLGSWFRRSMNGDGEKAVNSGGRRLFLHKNSKTRIRFRGWMGLIHGLNKLQVSSVNQGGSKLTQGVAGGGRNRERESPAARSEIQKWILSFRFDSSSNSSWNSLGVVLWMCRKWNGGRRVIGEGERTSPSSTKFRAQGDMLGSNSNNDTYGDRLQMA